MQVDLKLKSYSHIPKHKSYCQWNILMLIQESAYMPLCSEDSLITSQSIEKKKQIMQDHKSQVNQRHCVFEFITDVLLTLTC